MDVDTAIGEPLRESAGLSVQESLVLGNKGVSVNGRWVLPLVFVVAAGACGKSEPRTCKFLPSSVERVLDSPSGPPDMTPDMFRWGLLNVMLPSAESAPSEIKPAVQTVRDAIEQRWQPGVRLTDDEQVRAAAEQIDQWTAAHCAPKDTAN